MPRTYENKLRGGVCLLCSGNELEKEEPGPEINGDRFTGAFYFSRSGSPIPVCTGAYVRVGREAVDGFSKVHSIPPLRSCSPLLLLPLLPLFLRLQHLFHQVRSSSTFSQTSFQTSVFPTPSFISPFSVSQARRMRKLHYILAASRSQAARRSTSAFT